MSGKRDKLVSPGSVLPYPLVSINDMTFLEFIVCPMAISGLSPGNIGINSRTRYDTLLNHL